MISNKISAPCVTECVSTFSDARFTRMIDQENEINNLVHNIYDMLGSKLRSLLGDLPKGEDSPVEATVCCWVEELAAIQFGTECMLREIITWIEAL